MPRKKKPTASRDAIYILKKEVDTEELKFSLRSIEKNFPVNRVWFVGGQPKGFKNVSRLQHEQLGNCKWELIRSSMWKAVNEEDLTEEFFLFNDDFFVMKPVDTDKFKNFVDGTLDRRIQELHTEQGMNPYCRTLFKLEQELLTMKEPTMNYDVHLPMLLNKGQVKATLYKCSSPQMRSAIGNINGLPFTIHPDVKVYDLESVPTDETYLSTNDNTFQNGKVGQYIRDTFKDKSMFEE